MQIAICIGNSQLGGIRTSCSILQQFFQKAGHDVQILVTSPKAVSAFMPISKNGLNAEAVCPGEMRLRMRLKTVLERLAGYDVIINNHSFETQLILPALKKKIIRISVIRTTFERQIKLATVSSEYLDALVGISPQVSSLLDSETAIRCPVYTIPNATTFNNTDFPSLARKLKIVYVGRLVAQDKNIMILPEIAEELCRRGIDFKMTIAGDGLEKDRLIKRVENLGLESTIDFPGAMSSDEVQKLLCQSHFSIIPSNYEGFGLVLVESMATGCIPVTSNIPVFTWILGECSNELQTRVDDPVAYAGIIEDIAKDANYFKVLQENLKKRQQSNFAPEITVKMYLKLIKMIQDERNEKNFEPVSFGKLKMPAEYGHKNKIIFSKVGSILQKIKYMIDND